MPPGQTIPKDLSFATARNLLSAQDMERLACAFLNATDTVNFDAVKAAREFGGVQPESFKRSIWVITKKIKDYNAGNKTNGVSTPTKPKGKGRKRKAASEDSDDGESGIGATRRKAKRGSAKKARSEVANGYDDDDDEEFPVKMERTSAAEASFEDEGDELL